MENFTIVKAFEPGGFTLVDKRTSEKVALPIIQPGRFWSIASRDENLYVGSVGVPPMWLKSIFKLRVMPHPIQPAVHYVVPKDSPKEATKLETYVCSHKVCDLPLRIRGSKSLDSLKLFVLNNPWAAVRVFVSVPSLYSFVKQDGGFQTTSEWIGRNVPHWRKRMENVFAMSPDIHVRRARTTRPEDDVLKWYGVPLRCFPESTLSSA
eukprot:6465025-Amphidinium_carterae.3